MDLFEAKPPVVELEEGKSYYDELVGEGKKFKENEALARSKIHSDAMIATLQAEAAALREQVRSNMNMQDFLDQVKAAKEVPPVSAPPQATPTGISAEDINKILDERLTAKERERQQADNLRQVQETLIEKYGRDYTAHIETKASSLGLGKEFLNGLARDNPRAFLALVASDSRSSVPNVTPPTNMFGGSLEPVTAKTFADFQKIRRENPALYRSDRVQAEMHKLALADPQGFLPK